LEGGFRDKVSILFQEIYSDFVGDYMNGCGRDKKKEGEMI